MRNPTARRFAPAEFFFLRVQSRKVGVDVQCPDWASSVPSITLFAFSRQNRTRFFQISEILFLEVGILLAIAQ
jgi:hypothetical protein